MKNMLAFLQSQKLLTIACHNAADVWIANLYFAADESGALYFISPKDTKHSAMISENPRIAFSTAWFDESNHKNRKAVQGLGACRLAEHAEVETGISLLWKKFPDMHDILTVKWILTNAWGTRVWVIKPNFVKHWDDALYGDEESAEFTEFDKKN